MAQKKDPLENLPEPLPSYRRQKRKPREIPPLPSNIPTLPEDLKKALQEAEQIHQVAREAQEEVLFPQERMSASQADRLRAVLAEQAKRRLDGLRLYEPLPVQAAFHEGQARTRLLRGSNRGGKTLPAAVEVARAVTGRDPFGKYPREHGRWFCVGKDLSHVGQVMYRKLFRSGAFKMIRDLSTRAWRAYRPWDPSDLAREAHSKPAPPLIPARMVKSVAWENKAKSQPSLITLKNGWEINFYSSLGKPPQGSDIDGWWFDEEIIDPDWFPEMSARTLDRHGRGIWSATPQAGTDQLYDLHERAETERDSERPSVSEYVILLSENPHISREDKSALAADLTLEERKVRIDGDFALLSYKMYPEFDMHFHGMDFFSVPSEWCRYMVVDPGHQVCAVLFGAIPPPGQRECVCLYEELYLKECNATKFAEAVAQKLEGQVIQAFLIDPNMALYTEVGYGKNVAEQYSEALRLKGVGSVATGCHFLLASDDLDAGPLAVHDWLRPREDGLPKLRVLRGKLPNFEWEIKRYHRKRVSGQVTDRPDNKKNNHLMDCLRYLALYQPRYVRPSVKKARKTGAVAALKAKKERAKEKHGGTFIRLGPGRN